MTLALRAQNLVPNGSFEEYEDCPWGGGQVDLALAWEEWYYTPEYMHACSDSEWTAVPLNYFADQEPSHGNAYCGFIAWHGPGQNYSELIGVELSEPLVSGEPVHVSLKLAASIGGAGANFQSSCSHVGIRFTTEQQNWQSVTPLPNYAHLVLSEPLSLGGQWFTLSGIVVPDSAYRYLSVGRFHIVDSIEVQLINPEGNDQRAYFLVDEVCVTYDPIYCDFDLNINEAEIPLVSIHPNPCLDGFVLETGVEGRKTVRVLDMRGCVALEYEIDASTSYISLAEVPQGIYVVQVISPGYMIPLTKVVKMKP